MTTLNKNKYNLILNDGLKLPSELSWRSKRENTKLKTQNKNEHIVVNLNLLKKVQKIFDEIKPKKIPFHRSNSIYATLYSKHNFNLNKYANSNCSIIEIKTCEDVYISDQSMGHFMTYLRENGINIKHDEKFSFEIIRDLKKIATKYWEKDVMPLETFLKYYEHAPIEYNNLNWNCTLSKNECEIKNISRNINYPEVIINRNIPASDIKILRYKKFKVST